MTDFKNPNIIPDMPVRVFIFEDHWMCREALVSVLEKESERELQILKLITDGNDNKKIAKELEI